MDFDEAGQEVGTYACAVSEPETGAELRDFRRAGRALVDGVADHLAALPSRPVWQPLPDTLRERLLGLPLPERAATLDDLVATALREVLPYAMGNGHPAFFGWVNPPPSPAGIAASLAAAAMNPSVVAGDHADVHLERAAVRWLAELVGFPHAPGGGLLTSGGSAATIVCLSGARSSALAAVGHDVRRDGLAGAPRLVAYVPAEAHSCVRRALELLGLGSRALREVPLDGGRLDPAALRASIAADRAGGAVPALLVGSARTVSTAWSGPTRWCSTRTSGSGSPSTPAARSCSAATICATRSASSRLTCARTPARRSARSPSTAPSRRVRFGRSRRGRPSPRADAPALPPRSRARSGSLVSSRRWSSASPSWSWPPRPRPPSSRSAPARLGVRPRGWTTSTTRCPRRSKRAGAPSSPAPSSAAARRCGPASSTRTRAPSTSRPSSPKSSQRPVSWHAPSRRRTAARRGPRLRARWGDGQPWRNRSGRSPRALEPLASTSPCG